MPEYTDLQITPDDGRRYELVVGQITGGDTTHAIR